MDFVRPHVERQDTKRRRAIPVLKHKAMTAWWLANVSSFHLLSEQFAVGPSKAAEVIIKVCLAMEMKLQVMSGDIPVS